MPSDWGIVHLYRRAGFGIDLPTAQAKTAQSLASVVDELLDDVVDVTRPSFLDDDIGDWEKEYGLRAWWYDRMATAAKPLQEKMTLFWHGHFCSENAKVADMRLMWDQNNLFRTNCMGNFRQLVHDMSLQPAMLIYLDNAPNDKEAPNENFARELMELFTVGVNQYTQADIIAAARAWTGHNLDYDVDPHEYIFRPERHDYGNKTFMGQVRAWDGPEIIDFLLQESTTKKTTAAKFMARKLWTFFAYPSPAQNIVDDLAQILLTTDWNVKETLRALFVRPEFYSTTCRRGLVRPPVDWIVAILKATGLPMTEPPGDLPHFNLWGSEEMGQELFEPPNVAGWKNNAYWLGTTQYWARASWIWHYLWMLHEAGFLQVEVMDVLDNTGLGDARYATAVDNALRAFGIYWPSDNTRYRLTHWIKRQYEAPPADGEWDHFAWIFLTQLVVLSPEFMLA